MTRSQNPNQSSHNNRTENEFEIQQPFKNFSVYNYVVEELTQSSRKREEVTSADTSEDGYQFKNRVDTFISIPIYLETFMIYGWLQCFDHMLLVYTFLPVRCTLSIISYFLIKLSSFLNLPNIRHDFHKKYSFSLDLFTKPHELRDLIKFSLIIICTILMCHIDTSVVYHEIRTQSIMKLYIFFNLLELLDKLLSSVCQDALDDILLTVSLNHPEKFHKFSFLLPPNYFSRCKAFLLQYSFAFICIFGHCMLLLGQVTTLNVAFNTHQWSLLTVLISNNFAELKSSVFKKLGKTNLFQITCADIRERFHYSIWIFIVIFRNISANDWNFEYILELLFNGFCLFCAEIIVDWVKHAFITKFNFIPANVYEEYQVSIAYDFLKCRQGQHNGDYLDVMSRRMGLTPIPLACLINLMIYGTIGSFKLVLIVPIIIILLFLMKIGANLMLLNQAFVIVQKYIKKKLEEQHQTSMLITSAKVSGDNNNTNQSQNSHPIHIVNTGLMRRTNTNTTSDIRSVNGGSVAKRVHSDSFCAISPHDILRFKNDETAKVLRSSSPSRSRQRSLALHRQSSPIIDDVVNKASPRGGGGGQPFSPSPPSASTSVSQYHYPSSGNIGSLQNLRSRHPSSRNEAKHQQSSMSSDFFDFEHEDSQSWLREQSHLEHSSSLEDLHEYEAFPKDPMQTESQMPATRNDDCKDDTQPAPQTTVVPGQEATGNDESDDEHILSTSYVKQPLADIDRYQMYGGQIS